MTSSKEPSASATSGGEAHEDRLRLAVHQLGNAPHAPEGLSPDEKLVWLLGDLMNAVENYFGAENPKREGHLYCAAARIIDEVLTPLRNELEDARSPRPDTTAEEEAERAARALDRASGQLMWCAQATPGVAHEHGKELARRWSEQASEAAMKLRLAGSSFERDRLAAQIALMSERNAALNRQAGEQRDEIGRLAAERAEVVRVLGNITSSNEFALPQKWRVWLEALLTRLRSAPSEGATILTSEEIPGIDGEPSGFLKNPPRDELYDEHVAQAPVAEAGAAIRCPFCKAGHLDDDNRCTNCRRDVELGDLLEEYPFHRGRSGSPAALTSPSPPEGANYEAGFRDAIARASKLAADAGVHWHSSGDADLTEYGRGSKTMARNLARDIAALSTPPADTVAVPRKWLEQTRADLLGNEDRSVWEDNFAAEIDRLLQGGSNG